jgi:hypothetical protein
MLGNGKHDSPEAMEAVTWILSDIDCAHSDMTRPLAEIDRNRKLLEPNPPRGISQQDWQTNLTVPDVKSTSNAILAHVYMALMGNQVLRMTDVGGRDSDDYSSFWERYYHALWNLHVPFRSSMFSAIASSLMDGTSCCMTTYEERRGWKYGWIPDGNDPVTGQPVLKQKMGIDVIYDWPRFDIIPLDRFYVFPVYNADVQESPGVAVSWPLNGRMLLERSAQGIYDEAAVKVVLDSMEDSHPSPNDAIRKIQESNPELMKQRQPVDLIEAYFSCPGENGEPDRDWVHTIHRSSTTLLQARPNPWWHQRRPFSLCRPYRDAYGVLGDSVASTGVGDVQRARSRLLGLSIDAAKLGLLPPMFIAQSMDREMGNMMAQRYRPGGRLPVPDAILAATQGKFPLQPVTTGGLNPNQILGMMDGLDMIGQNASGRIDTNKDMAGAQNMTATQAQQMLAQAQKLLGMILQNCADFLVDVMRFQHELTLQFIGHTAVQRLWYEVNGNEVPIELAAQRQYLIEANGLIEANNAGARQARSTMIIEMLKGEPVMKDPEFRHGIYMKVAKGAGEQKPEDWFGTVADFTQRNEKVMQQEQAMLQMKIGLEHDKLNKDMAVVTAQTQSDQVIADLRVKASMAEKEAAHKVNLLTTVAGHGADLIGKQIEAEQAQAAAAAQPGQAQGQPAQPGQAQGQAPVPPQQPSAGQGEMNVG